MTGSGTEQAATSAQHAASTTTGSKRREGIGLTFSGRASHAASREALSRPLRRTPPSPHEQEAAGLCANIDGFSPHDAVGAEAHDRKRLAQLCRYITRPALSDERVQLNAATQVELKRKPPWPDGATHPVMLPLEFTRLHIECPLRGSQIRKR